MSDHDVKPIQETSQGKPLFRRIVSWALALILMSSAIILFFVKGNVQWHPWVYVTQAYYYPGYRYGIIRPPKGFSGEWQCWSKDRELWIQKSYQNGLLDGKYQVWNQNLTPRVIGVYQSGKKQGQWEYYSPLGEFKETAQWDQGKLITPMNQFSSKKDSTQRKPPGVHRHAPND